MMTTSGHWKWKKNYLTSPVTSVEFIGSDLILSGEINDVPFAQAYLSNGIDLRDSERIRVHLT